MSIIEEITLYQTAPHPCSYRKEQEASTVFVDPQTSITRQTLTYLSERGFRRSGEYIYLPHCAHCSACISTRVPVKAFRANRSQRRVWRKNQDIQIKQTQPRYTQEIYQLYENYINGRHADGDMYPATKDQFNSFLVNSSSHSCFFEMRCADQLVAVAVTDILENALSAVYTFFDPALSQRSLGVFSVLAQIEQTREKNLPYLYLGYWVKQCSKMNYKIRYRPIELLIDDQWIRLS